jgi:hypothetical protein
MLAEEERTILSGVLFGGRTSHNKDQRRRHAVVVAAARSQARSRADLFADLVSSPALRPLREQLIDLPRFCALADAGMDVMNACWDVVRESNHHGRDVPLGWVTDKGREWIDALRDEAVAWRQRSRLVPAADALATAIVSAGPDHRRVLAALLVHHAQYGGGARWLALTDGKVQRLMPATGALASRYRFRIAALCRMAVQCGQIRSIPAALVSHGAFDDEDGE